MNYVCVFEPPPYQPQKFDYKNDYVVLGHFQNICINNTRSLTSGWSRKLIAYNLVSGPFSGT